MAVLRTSIPPIASLGVVLTSLLVTQPAIAQTFGTDESGSAAVVSFLVYLPVAFLVINIALMLWLWPDAQARGIDRPVGWLVALFFLGPLALLFYLGTRPPGKLKQCDRCGEECTELASSCPHCGYSLRDALQGPLFTKDVAGRPPYAEV